MFFLLLGLTLFAVTSTCCMIISFLPHAVSADVIYGLIAFSSHFGTVLLKFINFSGVVLSIIFQILFGSIPKFVKIAQRLFHLFFRILQGFFCVADALTNCVTWLMFICGFLLLVDKHLSRRTQGPVGQMQVHEEQVPNDNVIDNIIGIRDEERDNDRNSRGEHERQLELENTENENEANIIGEAQRTNQSSDSEGDAQFVDTRLRRRSVHSSNQSFQYRSAQSRSPDSISSDNSEPLCVVCLERHRNVAVFPCGHTHTCYRCIRLIMNEDKLCPMCRSDIFDYQHIFL